MKRRTLEADFAYNAVIDLDGVIFDFENRFCKRFGDDHRDLVNLKQRYPDRVEEIERFVKDPKTYHGLHVMETGFKIAKYLFQVEQNCLIHIVTSRPIGAREETIRALSDASIYYDTFTLKSSNKEDVINSIEPDVVIDDIMGVLQGVHAPLRILVKHPWNETPFFPRITSVDQFIALWQRFVHENVPNHSRRIGVAKNLSRTT